MGSHRKPWTSNILIFSVYCEFHHNSEMIIMNTFLRLHHLASLKAFIPDVFTGSEEHKYNHNGCFVCQKSPFEVNMRSVRSCWLGNVCIIWNEAFFLYVQHMYVHVCGGVKRHRDKLHVSISRMFSAEEGRIFSLQHVCQQVAILMTLTMCVIMAFAPAWLYTQEKKVFLHVNIFIGKISLTT